MVEATETREGEDGMEERKGRGEDLDIPGAGRGERSGEDSILAEPLVPDPEVSAKASRRRYSAEYKLKILKQADSMGSREVGALLRREGLYRSHLITWRRQREKGELEGLSPRKRGRKPNPDTQLIQKCARLERENERLDRKIEQMETIIEFQKKMGDLLKRSEETPRE